MEIAQIEQLDISYVWSSWSDDGGRRVGDETAWQTTVGKCMEEAGVDIIQ